MNLIGKQKAFPGLLAKLFEWLIANGYEVTLGEAWRPPEMAAIYKARGIGITNSLHWLRLAIDLNLWKDGVKLELSEQYRAPGEFWESLSTPDAKCSWGGRFSDGNHFSIEHEGVR